MNLIWRDIYYNKICASVLLPNKLRILMYRWGGIQIEKDVRICPHCFVGNKNLKIGKGTFVNYNVWFNTAGGIEIGSNCNIAYRVTFVTSTHELDNSERRAGLPLKESIKVGNGVWIGANAMIMPGIEIGNGVVIAAGAVVTKNCEENCIYAGVPARKVRIL